MSLSAKHEEPRAGESLARLSDHLGRLLAHADKLLAEWQAHAEGLRGRLDRETAASGEALARALRAAIAEAGQQAGAELRQEMERARRAAAGLEAHGRPASPILPVLLSGLSAILAGAVLYVVVARRPAEAPPPPAPIPAVVVPDAAVVDAPPPPPPPAPAAAPCASLRVDTPTTAPKLVGACVAELCGPARPKLLAECKRDDGAGGDLVAALRTVERDRPFIKLACAPPRPDADGRHTVTVRWLLDCAAMK